VKQLRISRFLSALYLSQSQRELIKFLKVYSLNKPKRGSKRRNAANSYATD